LGTTDYIVPPELGSGRDTIDVFLEITVNGLGASPWVPAGSVTGLDPGVGAVVDNGAGSDFMATLEFFADLSDYPGFDDRTPLNVVPQLPSPGPTPTVSSFAGGFFAERSGHFTCYRIKENKWKPKEVVVVNQFGEFYFTLTKPEQLCVPSSKMELTTEP
jgi:hypothetical protein